MATPLSPSLPDAIRQVSPESEQDLSVSCLNHSLLAFADNCQIQDSGSGIFEDPRGVLVAGGTYSPLSPLLPDAMMQVSRESEQNLSVSCLNGLLLVFVDNCQNRDFGSGLFGNPQNLLITGGTFVAVSLSCGLYEHLIIVYILSARTIFYSLILEKGI